jgi:Uma2 family endonuclease
LIRGDSSDYADRHPGAGDVALVVEVADASLEADRTLKKAIYASAGIPVYWILNLIVGRLEVYSDPGGPAGHADYRNRCDYTADEEVALLVGGREVARIPVRELLP